LGLHRVRLDAAGNALGEIPGIGSRGAPNGSGALRGAGSGDGANSGASSPVVVIAAHLDTVVPPGISIRVKRDNGRLCAPGISDNGAGLTAMLGIIAALSKAEIETDATLLFAATVGEEGEGDLYGMRCLFADSELRRRTTAAFVIDGAATSHITTSGLGSRRFQVEVSGPGGHSWSDFGRVNPIVVLSTVISDLSRIPLPATPRTSLNIGMIHGGTAVNAIPDSAWMKVDIRSTRTEEIGRLGAALEAAVKAAVRQESDRATGTLEARITELGNRPVAELPDSAALLAAMQEVDRYLGNRSRLECSSTDANIPLSLGIEAIATGGGGAGGDAHSAQEWFDPRGREFGLKRLLLAILMMAGMANQAEG
jgi:acetylornithine deacetylase/succinyl-diaminopimelate desuccinylase-like protein